MNPIHAYLVGTAILVTATLIALARLRGPLKELLDELCGASHRGTFWLHYFQVGVVLAVVVMPMIDLPEGSEPAGFFDVLAMLRFGLVGLLAALGGLAVVLMSFISSHDRRASEEPAAQPPTPQ